ncbi:MAG: hypothetical protein CL959_05320 [Euryarchaeota archaeon]|jgi:DNA-binding CsgD family transcriptional regulator|nr:hypothetical protein [Euryarchaeota archaeon]|tara:strand:- start:251 stop:847 length:597 start_codon:yes stop_codon:yes gene_type:complete
MNNFSTTNLTNSLRQRKYKERFENQLLQNGSLLNVKDQTIMANANESIRFDIARLEAKVDIILNHIMNGGKQETSSQSKELNAAELALLRGMTTKQHVVLQLLIEGLRNQDIAPIMGIGENTVKLHVRSVCKKIGVKTRGQAAMVGSDILNRANEDEYQKLSGGLPLNWSDNYETNDRYAPLYVSSTTPMEGGRFNEA